MNDLVAELEILKGIVGDLSGVGLWIAVLYCLYKIVVIGALLYSLRYVVGSVIGHLSADVTKAEAKVIIEASEVVERRNKDLASELAREQKNFNVELDRVKHMYKILKEKAGDSG